MPLDSTTYETPVMSLLRRARALLSRRGAWTQGWLAASKATADMPSLEVDPTDSGAVAFCMLGALQHEVEDAENSPLYHEACHELALTIKPSAAVHFPGFPAVFVVGADEIIPDYNDDKSRQKRTILRAYDRTIARLRALVTA